MPRETSKLRKAKAEQIVDKLRVQRLGRAAELVYNTVAETLAYYAFPRNIGGEFEPITGLND